MSLIASVGVPSHKGPHSFVGNGQPPFHSAQTPSSTSVSRGALRVMERAQKGALDIHLALLSTL